MPGELPQLVATVVVVVGLVWLLNRYLGWRRKLPPDLDRPYSVFTKDFDVLCRGREVPQVLRERGASGTPSTGAVHPSLEHRIEIANEAYAACAAEVSAAVARLAALQGQAAVTIIVDQSGSMVNRMPGLAGKLRAVVESLGWADIPTSLLGFTTCGWRGGNSREKWMRAGRPNYPGRLCDLLYIIYKDFDELLEEDDWRAMMHADALFENLDGEALEWARSRLEGRAEANRVLIVVSDGAPVDDSSLSENGPAFLERHLLKTIDDTTRHGAVKLGAIGIGHRVDRYYAKSETTKDAEGFPMAFFNLIGKLLAESDVEHIGTPEGS